MKPVSVTVKGDAENRHAMKRRKAAATAAAVAQVQSTAHAIVNEARGHLDNASRLPVSRTGELASSLHVVRSADGLLANIRTRLDYGAFLEFGTRNMPAYPWLGPAARKHLAGFKARIRTASSTRFKGLQDDRNPKLVAAKGDLCSAHHRCSSPCTTWRTQCP